MSPIWVILTIVFLHGELGKIARDYGAFSNKCRSHRQCCFYRNILPAAGILNTWFPVPAACNRKKKLRYETSHIFAQTTNVALPPPKLSCGVGPGRQPCQVSPKPIKGFQLPEGSNSVIFLSLALWFKYKQVRATAV